VSLGERVNTSHFLAITGSTWWEVLYINGWRCDEQSSSWFLEILRNFASFAVT
jgi:hypothetical protein